MLSVRIHLFYESIDFIHTSIQTFVRINANSDISLLTKVIDKTFIGFFLYDCVFCEHFKKPLTLRIQHIACTPKIHNGFSKMSYDFPLIIFLKLALSLAFHNWRPNWCGQIYPLVHTLSLRFPLRLLTSDFSVVTTLWILPTSNFLIRPYYNNRLHSRFHYLWLCTVWTT